MMGVGLCTGINIQMGNVVNFAQFGSHILVELRVCFMKSCDNRFSGEDISRQCLVEIVVSLFDQNQFMCRSLEWLLMESQNLYALF